MRCTTVENQARHGVPLKVIRTGNQLSSPEENLRVFLWVAVGFQTRSNTFVCLW